MKTIKCNHKIFEDKFIERDIWISYNKWKDEPFENINHKIKLYRCDICKCRFYDIEESDIKPTYRYTPNPMFKETLEWHLINLRQEYRNIFE